MRFSALAFALICFGCTPSPDAREQALIAEAERRVQLPKGAGALRCYRRYYHVVRGRQLEAMLGSSDEPPLPELLVGTYREPEEGEAPGIMWVASREDVPEMYDGGCRDMTVW